MPLATLIAEFFVVHYSVVIPLYNKAPFVRVTLASVLAQSCQDFEIIVVDDGSKDDGAAIAESLGDPRIRVIRQINAGVAAARNRGVQEARGTWVAFLDADDWWHPEFLSRMQAVAAQHPQVAIVAGTFKMENHRDDWQPTPWPVPASAPVEVIHNLPRRWLKGPTFCTGAVTFKRTLLMPLMPCFPVGERLGEDLDLWFRAAERSPVAFLPIPFLCYRMDTPNSLFGVRPKPELLPFLARLQQRALRGDMPAPLRRDALRLVADARVSLARSALAAGERQGAMAQLKAGWRGMTGHRWWVTVLMAFGLAKGRAWR